MPYRATYAETKANVILEHLRGQRICSLAHRYKVNEGSIPLWKSTVLDALPKILASKKPEPQKSSVKELREQVEELGKENQGLSQIAGGTRKDILEIRPARYPDIQIKKLKSLLRKLKDKEKVLSFP